MKFLDSIGDPSYFPTLLCDNMCDMKELPKALDCFVRISLHV